MKTEQQTEQQRIECAIDTGLENVDILRAQAIPDPKTSITLPVSTVKELLAAHDEVRPFGSKSVEHLRKLLGDLGHD